MKCIIPEIFWHNRDPVLSVDIQPIHISGGMCCYRLASGGTDTHVLIWYLTFSDIGALNLELAADLTRHQRAVNVVRWSPCGQLLATGDDESVIFVWKQKSENEAINILDTSVDTGKEMWINLKILRGHTEDVYDLSWSPNSQFLISGSVDNTAMIWDIEKGRSVATLNDHKGFVQGVAWDPKNQYLGTLSSDRYFRIFDIQTKKIVSRIYKSILPMVSEISGNEVMRLYHDDTLQTFFRRLSFSPDGNLIVTPSGVVECHGSAKAIETTYIYSRYCLSQPAIILPSAEQYTVAVRFCPLYFNLRPHVNSNEPIVVLPYRMIFAVATKSSVYLYDTQQKMPFGLIANIHYTRLTDLTWSHDGRILVVSSTDGFCSLITFEAGELGEIYNKGNNSEVLNVFSKSEESLLGVSKYARNLNEDKVIDEGQKICEEKKKHDAISNSLCETINCISNKNARDSYSEQPVLYGEKKHTYESINIEDEEVLIEDDDSIITTESEETVLFSTIS